MQTNGGILSEELVCVFVEEARGSWQLDSPKSPWSLTALLDQPFQNKHVRTDGEGDKMGN